MKDFKLDYQSFPDPLAPDEEKVLDEYGLKWAEAIQYEWFHKSDSGTSAYGGRKDEYHRLRTYARGDQDTQLYKDLMAPSGSSYTNYDWRPIQVIPKFVKLIVNQMSERLFEIQASATDPYSTDQRGKYRERLENLMAARPMLMKAKELQGVDLISDEGSEGIPDTQEEIDLRMKLKFKLNGEIAAETAIKYTLDLNDFEETQSRVIEDITTLGVGGTKRYTDIHKGVVVDYIDPADMVYSYPSSRDFKNVYYFGEVERITIGELRRTSGLTFDEEALKELGGAAKSWSNYHGESSTRTNREGDLDGMMVDVMHFTYKANGRTTYKKKYGKGGSYKMIKRESTFDKVDDAKEYDVVKKDREVWYEGSLILGTKHLYNYKKAENMVREKGQLNRTLPKYTMYAPEMYQGRAKSLVGRVIQYVDLMQQIHIKIQQMVAKARPAGIYIDVNGLEEIPLGDGNTLTPLEVIKIYDETGNVLGTSLNAEGGYNYGKQPISELKNGVIDGIDRLINTYNFYLNQLRDAIGIPAGMDGSNPHPDTLVGVQKEVAANSNTSTRHILDSVLHITKRTAIGVTLNLKDIFKYSDLKEAYINAIGKINVDILESLKNFHLHDFGIIIHLKPDFEQKQALERNVQIALDKESITLDDAIDIRQVGNLKLANELLKIRRQKREKDKKAHEANMVKLNAEENAKAAERASAAKQQADQAEFQSKSQLEQIKGQNAIAKIKAEEEAKARLMEKEFMYNMTLKGAEAEFKNTENALDKADKKKEKDHESTKASKLIEQRQNNAPAVTFESSEDNISGGVEMGELEPS